MSVAGMGMEEVVAWLEENPSRFTLGPHCEIASDPGQWGHSLVNNAEILLPCLNAVDARSVCEVGSYAGDVTRFLLRWAADRGARLWAIDPSPQESLVELAERHANVELVRETSHEALRHLPLPDAVIIDGDHNYFTVTGELELIEERAAAHALPLLVFHDVRWPHGRRDHYFEPKQIPAEHRHPTVNGGLFPGDPGIRPDGLPYKSVAVREGGPRNGVLTAVEDFVNSHEGLECAIVPTFFGLAVVWHQDAPWSSAVAEALRPYDRHPVLERVEANRVLHLASMHAQAVHTMAQAEKNVRKDEFLSRLLESKTFGVAERLSKLRQGGRAAFSKDEIRKLLSD